MTTRGFKLLLAMVAMASALVGAGRWAWKDWQAAQSLRDRVRAVQPAHAVPAQPCHAGEAPARVLLVLGQSNAGNHGAEDEPPEMPRPGPLQVFTGSGCQRVSDPLPGATGRHASIWTRLPLSLSRLGDERPVVVAILAVDATRIVDWTRPDGPVVRRLDALLAQMRFAGLRPDAVLWQQGEADALDRTTADDYAEQFLQLRDRLRAAGIAAPIYLAGSTVCKNGDTSAVRTARARLIAQYPDLAHGADTDRLQGPLRVSGCHFSRQGLTEAADLWASVLVTPSTRDK